MKKIGVLLALAAIVASTLPASAWVARGGGGWRNGGWAAHGGGGWGRGYGYGPGWGGVAAGVATGVAVGAAAGAAATYSTLPPACGIGPDGNYVCGGTPYRPVYAPGGVVYQPY